MSTDTIHVIAQVDACSEPRIHEPHLRQHLWLRQDGKPHSIPWLWCLGGYDQDRQNRRVVVAVTDDEERLVGEGLTTVGSAYREPREPNPASAGGCGECREPEDFDWHPTMLVSDGPVIVCFRHGALAPGWAYEVEVGALAYRNEPLLRKPAPEPGQIVDVRL